ncbi:hypothetical protein FNJ87_07990, partial [Nonlabens mediterrranea]|nr:hypothetical protein [Nonlabens mediterrranea]
MHKLNVLIIYLLSLLSSEAQSLRIEYKTTITANEKIVDSITNQKEFQDFNQLSEYNDSIIRRLHLTGYINLLAKPLRKENEKTYIQVLKLNKKVRYAKIEASSENKELKELIETSLARKRNNNIIEIKDINKKTEEIYQFISDEGYPFTRITTQPLYNNKKVDTLTLRLDISIRDKRKIDNIVVKGYNKFPKKYLDRIINQHLTLNQNNINTITTLLKDIPFIQIEKEPEIQFKKDSTIIYTYLSKRNSNSADGLIGFNNTESGRIELNGYIDLTLLNNLNRGEKLNIVYRGENEDQTKLDINLEIPYILNSNLGITSGLNLLRRDSTYQNTSINAGLFYSITPKSSLGLSYN